MVQCDDIAFEGCLAQEVLADDAEANGWMLNTKHGNLCPACADARALEAEHTLESEAA
jgi:hypothetical protein